MSSNVPDKDKDLQILRSHQSKLHYESAEKLVNLLTKYNCKKKTSIPNVII